MKKVAFVVMAIILCFGAFGCSSTSSNITMDQLKDSLKKISIEVDNFVVNESSDHSYTFEQTVDSYTQEISITGAMDKDKNLTHVRIENHGVDAAKYLDSTQSIEDLLKKANNPGSLTAKDLKASFCILEMEGLYSLCTNAGADAALTVAISSLTATQPIEANKWKFIATKDAANGVVVVEAEYIGK